MKAFFKTQIPSGVPTCIEVSTIVDCVTLYQVVASLAYYWLAQTGIAYFIYYDTPRMTLNNLLV